MIYSNQEAPQRAKVSTDFGTVNTDLNTAAVVGNVYIGTTRSWPGSKQGILINVNVPEDQVDVLLTSPTFAVGNPGFLWRPARVAAGGFVGWVHTPLGGLGHPTGLPDFAVYVRPKVAIPSLIVTTQVFDY